MLLCGKREKKDIKAEYPKALTLSHYYKILIANNFSNGDIIIYINYLDKINTCL